MAGGGIGGFDLARRGDRRAAGPSPDGLDDHDYPAHNQSAADYPAPASALVNDGSTFIDDHLPSIDGTPEQRASQQHFHQHHAPANRHNVKHDHHDRLADHNHDGRHSGPGRGPAAGIDG
jgi:hypothetical protein